MKRDRTRTGGRSRSGRAAALVATACLATSTAACGSSGASSATVSLVPIVEGSGEWEWSHECRVGPVSASGCDASAPNLGTAQLAANAWNLGGRPDTTGSLRMAVQDDGSVRIDADLSTAPPCTTAGCIAPEANTWVRGFPSVLYGIDQCNAATSPPQSAHLQLPMRVGAIPNGLIGTTTYSSDAARITYTVAYDLWLNPTDTLTPCRTNGTIEVMVWTDHDAESLLPDSMRSANATIPYAIDGVAHDGTDAWAVYASNVFGGGETAPWGGTVWLVLSEDHVSSGTVSVDLTAALAAVGGLLQDVYGFEDFAGTYWLDTIAFGIEFGPDNGDIYGDGPSDFTLDLESYCLEVASTVKSAGC